VVTNLMCNVFTAWYGTELDWLLSVYVDAIFHTSSKDILLLYIWSAIHVWDMCLLHFIPICGLFKPKSCGVLDFKATCLCTCTWMHSVSVRRVCDTIHRKFLPLIGGKYLFL